MVRRLVFKLLTVLTYCHKMGVIHNDLKPENIMLGPQGTNFAQMKIIDFGSALSSNEQFDNSACSVFNAPEVVLKICLDPRGDVWSIGVIAYLLLSGYLPFHGNSEPEIFKAILRGKFDFSHPVWHEISSDAKEFITMLLTYDYKLRPSAE